MTNDEKMAELILYVSDKCQSDDTYGSTKLNKILFSADFQHYAKHGRSITEQEYMRLNQGPAPRQLVPIRNRLVENHELVVREMPYRALRQKRPIALREADLSAFNGEEIATVDAVIDQLWGLTAAEVTERSHRFIGWRLAKDRETIPYDTALLLMGVEPSEDDHAAARELAEGRIPAEEEHATAV